MNGIAISIQELLIKGVPEGILIVLALHWFTNTKINLKKSVFLSVILIVATYLIRLLPIKLGINTMLSLLLVILFFQITYRTQLDKLIRLVTSAVITLIIIMISEALNIQLLILVYGPERTTELLNMKSIEECISTIPSTVFTAIFIFIGHLCIKHHEKRKLEHGKASESTGT